jgi:hypothetical protein
VSEPGAARTTAIGLVLFWLAVAATIVAAVIAATGGFTFHVAGARLSMHAVVRPVVAAVSCGALALLCLGREAASRRLDQLSNRVAGISTPVAIGFAITIGVATFVNGAHVAGGTDSAGYLGQARLWRSGNLRIETPLSHQLQLSNGQYVFTPAGYQPASIGASVPAYPPGLPLMMAAAGERAQFMVVPCCAAAIVMLAFALGRKVGGDDTALLAAAAAGASPILLVQAVQPMSDVPAAFWWTLAIWLLLIKSPMAAVLAGLAAAAACFVRPNMFAMTPLLGLVSLWWNGWNRSSIARVVLVAAPIGIAAAGFVWLQQALFGGATTTGYGPVETLFSVDHVWRNLARYPRWAIHVQSALIVIGLAAPFLIARGWLSPSMEVTRAVRLAWSGWLLYAALQVLYLLYLVFDDWVYFRFLLPALPLVLVLQAATLAAATRFAPPASRRLIVLALAILIASWGVGRARGLGAFGLQDSEQRYLDVAEFSRSLPPDAVFVTLQYSASLWYYRSAPILRWDWIDALEIDGAVETLVSRGQRVYAVIDDWELPGLRLRYTGTRFVTRLTTPIFTAGVPRGIKAQVYDVTGTSATAAAAPVSSRLLLALQSPRRPEARDREGGSVNSCRSAPGEATRNCGAHH